jgi:hypothetical protein
LEEIRNREFHRSRHTDFLAQLERRDVIADPASYAKEKNANALRYKELKGSAQVIWGSVTAPEGMDLGARLRMGLRPSQGAHSRTVLDDKMHFAFPVAEPGEYEVTLFETSSCPGVRLEKVVVGQNQSVAEVVIPIEEASVEVTVKDMYGKPVAAGQVTVGKSRGGTDMNLFTWRKGLSDSNGVFVGRNLTDGEYVVVVYTEARNGSTSVAVATNEYRKVAVMLTHDN